MVSPAAILRQPFALLRFGAAMFEEAAADHDGRHVRLDHQRLAEFLHDDQRVDRAAAEAAMLFGQRRRQQAEFGELLPMVWDRAPDRRA